MNQLLAVYDILNDIKICAAVGSLIDGFEATCNFLIQSQLPAIIEGFVHDNLDPTQVQRLGTGALPGKMLLVRIIENNKIDAYFRSG